MDVSKLPYHHPSPWDTEIESTTMPALFGRAVDAHPQRTLIEFLGRKLSYQAMHAEARRFAGEIGVRHIEVDSKELEDEGAKSDVKRKVRDGGEREMRQLRDRAQRELDRLEEIWTTAPYTCP